MGDRVSISFRNVVGCGRGRQVQDSPVLFDHWGGFDRAIHARDYAQQLRDETGRRNTPLDRLEPGYILVDYLRELVTAPDFEASGLQRCLYLGATVDNGDNSGNGHFTIDLTLDPVDFAEASRSPTEYPVAGVPAKVAWLTHPETGEIAVGIETPVGADSDRETAR